MTKIIANNYIQIYLTETSYMLQNKNKNKYKYVIKSESNAK